VSPRQRGFFAVIQPFLERKMLMKKNLQKNNAQKMLHEYRPLLWRKVALEAVPKTRCKELKACIEQMCLIQTLIDVVRSEKLLGEKLYWIIYVSYMTEKQPSDVDEILSVIAQKYKHIPRRTYFRLKGRAIKIMDNLLKEQLNEKEKFIKQDNRIICPA
jgi:hypothetical protein